MATAQLERMLTAVDVAERLDVSLMAVSRWMRTRELRAINVAEKGSRAKKPQWRVLPKDFEEFLRQRSNQPRGL